MNRPVSERFTSRYYPVFLSQDRRSAPVYIPRRFSFEEKNKMKKSTLVLTLVLIAATLLLAACPSGQVSQGTVETVAAVAI